MRKVPYFKGELDAFQLISKKAMYRGLLLALAFENLAEYVHERRQLSKARRELALEAAENRRTWASNVTEAARIQQELDADLRLIQAVRSHAPVGDLKFEYSHWGCNRGKRAAGKAQRARSE